MNKLNGFLSTVLLGFSPLLFATSPYEHGEGWHGIVGLAIFNRTEPVKDVNRIWLLPNIIMRRSNFFIEGLEIGYRAIEGPKGYFDLRITPRLDGFNADESACLNGMEDREYSLDGGIATTWRQDDIEFKLSILTDLLSKSNGQEITVSLGKSYILTNKMTNIAPRFGLKWQSDNLVNYYYGVKPSEARTNRPSYNGESALNYIATLNVIHLLNKRSTLFLKLEYERFGNNIYDSPIVDTDKMFSVFIGYGWQF